MPKEKEVWAYSSSNLFMTRNMKQNKDEVGGKTENLWPEGKSEKVVGEQ